MSAHIFKSGFPTCKIGNEINMNFPVNIERVFRVRYYDAIDRDRPDHNNYRIIFEGDKCSVTWTYDTKIKRDYEWEKLGENFYDASRPTYDFEKFVEENSKPEPVIDSEEATIEATDVFVYREKENFFVVDDEAVVLRRKEHYEKAKYLK